MSKYIIELDDRIKLVTSVGVTENGVVYTTSDYVHNLEELNSDYINEHFGSLQDEAYKQGYAEAERIWRAPSSDNEFYQKGLEDGKKSTEKGCDGCEHENQKEGASPCCECARVCDDHYIPKRSDRIEVGDEVEWDGDKYIVTYLNYDIETSEITDYDLLAYDGSVVDHVKKCTFTKTGKHYDIQSILEAMRK